jgi:hypothetical protein
MRYGLLRFVALMLSDPLMYPAAKWRGVDMSPLMAKSPAAAGLRSSEIGAAPAM